MSELTLALSPCQLPTFFFLPSLPELFDELSSCISPLEVQQDVPHKPELLLCSLLPTLLSCMCGARGQKTGLPAHSWPSAVGSL